MHKQNFDLSIDEIAKIEGHAALDIKVRGGKIADLKFRIADYKRFYTKAVEGKPVNGVPQQVARICGTCSNAHLLCSIKAVENALGIKATKQTKILRKLLNYGLMIRDHALHLYVFVLPDLFGHDSILDFDEKNKKEHQFLHDAFAVKEAGNILSIWAGGRSVHAPYAAPGGFTKLPNSPADELVKKLKNIRNSVLRLIFLFKKEKNAVVEENPVFLALDDPDFGFLQGDIIASNGTRIKEKDFHNYLSRKVIPYSQASAYMLKGENGRNKILMLGALSRLNLLKHKLHKNTKKDVKDILKIFPSNNIFYNNLAQAVEILHSIDSALDLLCNFSIKDEKPLKIKPKSGTGTAVTEAPRGLLFHEYKIDSDGKVEKAKIVVPTGVNQILIEKSLRTYLSDKLDLPKDKLALKAEQLIRAYDPCISCATHFLKVNWN